MKNRGGGGGVRGEQCQEPQVSQDPCVMKTNTCTTKILTPLQQNW